MTFLVFALPESVCSRGRCAEMQGEGVKVQIVLAVKNSRCESCHGNKKVLENPLRPTGEENLRFIEWSVPVH